MLGRRVVFLPLRSYFHRSQTVPRNEIIVAAVEVVVKGWRRRYIVVRDKP